MSQVVTNSNTNDVTSVDLNLKGNSLIYLREFVRDYFVEVILRITKVNFYCIYAMTNFIVLLKVVAILI